MKSWENHALSAIANGGSWCDRCGEEVRTKRCKTCGARGGHIHEDAIDIALACLAKGLNEEQPAAQQTEGE